MITFIKNTLLRFKKKQNYEVLLGRWGNYGTEIKNIYANHDNCGDIICKNPKDVTNIIKNQLKKIK